MSAERLADALTAALESALRDRGLDVREVVSWRDVTRRGGNCETCYWEKAGVDIDYIDSDGDMQTYDYQDGFAALIRELTDEAGDS